MPHQECTLETGRFKYSYIDCLTKKMLKHAWKMVTKYIKHERKTLHLQPGYIYDKSFQIWIACLGTKDSNFFKHIISFSSSSVSISIIFYLFINFFYYISVFAFMHFFGIIFYFKAII